MMKYELEIDVSPVYELLDSFMLYVTKKWISNLEIGTDWVRDVDGRFPPMQLAALKQAAEWPFDDYDVLYAWAYSRGKHPKYCSSWTSLKPLPLRIAWCGPPLLPQLHS